MAVSLIFSSALIRTTVLAPFSSPYTCLFWFKPFSTITAPNYTSLFLIRDASYTGYMGIFGEASSIYNITADNGSGPSGSAARILTVGTWYPIVYQRAASNSHAFAIADDLVGSASEPMSVVTPDAMILGYDGFSTDVGDIAYFREWGVNITASQVRSEFDSPVAVRTANLIADTPLTSDLLDISGNGNNWSWLELQDHF